MTPASLTHKRLLGTLILSCGLVFPTCLTARSTPKTGTSPYKALVKIETWLDVTEA
jgi:hypothetical protein